MPPRIPSALKGATGINKKMKTLKSSSKVSNQVPIEKTQKKGSFHGDMRMG
jgi:hypothetical protein